MCRKKPIINKTIPDKYVTEKLIPRLLLKKKGKKNNKDVGIPTKMLFAKIIVLSRFLCSIYENASDIMLSNGRAIMKPANEGFL